MVTMKFALLVTLVCVVNSTWAEDIYGYVAPSRDGTGKIYQGREISLVMGHLGASWLERPSREREERTDLLLSNLPIDDSSVVADIGAGTGYFTFRLANRVRFIYAVDIQQEMIDIMERRISSGGFDNVETVLGSEIDPSLPKGSIDLIFIVDAYHEFSHPYEMGRAMVEALRPGGKLVLIEYRAEDPGVPIKRLHKMSQEQVVKEMSEIGMRLHSDDIVLPQQHFLVFKK